MTQQTVLKDEQINQIRRSMQPWQLMNEFARAIEQAVLQSPEVKDLASALRALLDALPSATAHPAIQKARAALAAMEKQK
ncbi:hypothetical protein [Pusillimonas sp. NJUB218]|uniref:hypothetical protein n=1 Tax=Pusillimonas sp. NJUB218 TaxID=2023230 RepID=UPI000F4C7C8C|nr:hypothetical protein [Pusillimonas sp. NJUB218]ROT45052.1 hypothetical protein CHR62_09380 [Pusillimonas sp. NJUB218]